MNKEVKSNRRNLIKWGLTAAGALTASKAIGQTCEVDNQAHAQQPLGPFYPNAGTPIQDPKEYDNNLATTSLGDADGEKIRVFGKVENTKCEPVEDAMVVLWQACATGRYNHQRDPNTEAPLDKKFQYFGFTYTDAEGNYEFLTIKPGAYPATLTWMRPPHLHVRVVKRGHEELITQMYFEGEKHNKTDRILQDLEIKEQNKVVVEFAVPEVEEPTPESSRDEQEEELIPEGRFDITIREIE